MVRNIAMLTKANAGIGVQAQLTLTSFTAVRGKVHTNLRVIVGFSWMLPGFLPAIVADRKLNYK